MASGFSQLEFETFFREPALETGGMEFETSGHLEGRRSKVR